MRSFSFRPHGKTSFLTGTFLVLVYVFLIAEDASAGVKAFPTAEGFGATTVGGRGGRIIYVTNTNDSGLGSLRQALSVETGPRIVIFKVGGTITLSSKLIMSAANSYATVAWHTAPGGVQVRGPIQISNGAKEIIFRHCRVRSGPGYGYEDSLSLWANTAEGLNNIIIDHCSVEWGYDETLSITASPENSTTVPLNNITVQRTIVAEGVGIGTDGNPHQLCTLINGGAARISFHHSLFAHCSGRFPLAANSQVLDWVNNINYNYGGNNGPQLGGPYTDNRTAKVNFVNNKYIAGPTSGSGSFGFSHLGNGDASRARGGTKVYFPSGNLSTAICPTGCVGNEWNGWKWRDSDLSGQSASESKYRVFTPFTAPALTVHSVSVLESEVLSTVGAYKASRDAVDTRIVNDVIGRTGSIPTAGQIPSPGYPTLGGGTYPMDSDNDGMPDSWESSHGLNPNNSSDGPAISSNGYTNVENYLNELAGDTIPGMVSSLLGDLNSDRIVNSLDWSLMSAKWLTSDTSSDLNKDGSVNSLDWSIMSANWLKTG